MSRIGKKPIQIPEKIEIKIEGDLVIVKGPKGELKLNLVSEVKVEKKENKLIVKINNEENKKEKSLWGTYRQLIENMVIGVNEGFEKKLEINGVGFRSELKGKDLILNIGFSHPVEFKIPEGITIQIEKNIISISGIDKQLVGETAAQIRKIKKPEPYKGKGIKYIDEVIRRKAGKQAKTVA